jgi:serine/threonine-protein kinase
MKERTVSTVSLEGRNLGKYRVLEPLGRGGMARVYRAYHPQLDRYVAIKVLRSDLVDGQESDDASWRARFQREARAVAALRHPNVVQVFDFDAQDGIYYMVMELLEGDTLRTRLNDYRVRDQYMPLGEVARILFDVLEGLGYAHSEGMIHRDVKPANVLLSRRGQAVLTDFGIAQIVGGTRYTVSGALMGTLNYMSPEQGLEGQCDARSDIYSLGIVFYEMLTGDPPFDAETPLAILMKHVNDPLPLPREVNPAIPEPFERVVLKALSKRREARYQSAGEMARALRRAVKETEVALPARISLPLSFTTAEAPSESVAVISGTAREQMRDADFAADDTQITAGRLLAVEDPAIGGAQQTPSETPEAAAGPVGHAEGEDREVHLHAPARPQPGAGARRGATQTILNAVGLVLAGNLVVILFGLITGWWGVFGRGWPFELLLVGLMLSMIMQATGSVWILIPTGIVLGNGYLMSFYAITGWWRLWAILWPLEVLLIVGTVLYTIRLANEWDRARQVSHRLADALRRPTLVLAIVVVLLGAIFGS